MLKKIFLFLLPGTLIFAFWGAYRFYGQYQEKKYRDSFYQNLVDTSSPTVTVLRDSILVGYRNEKKTIHIYVPPEYEKDTTSKYPVNDLENMGPEWQIDEVINSASANQKPTAIVIGINDAEDQDAEYTPFVNKDNPEAHGEAYAKWVANDLKHWVDENYRTDTSTSATTIGGISRSGMMAYYMLMAHPETFGNAVIQSPAMWVDYDRLMAMELSAQEIAEKKIFVSVGEYEGSTMIPAAEAIYEKFKALGLKEDALKYELIPNEGHWHVTWRKSFALAYPWLME